MFTARSRRDAVRFTLLLLFVSAIPSIPAFGRDADTGIDPVYRGLVTSMDRADRVILGNRDFLRRELRANTFTSSSQSHVAVDLDTSGEFVVAWDSRRQEEGTYGVYAQCFDALGRRIGGERQVNSFAPSTQWHPTVTANPSGRFWIGWESFGRDGHLFGCFARVFDSDLETSEAAVRVHPTRIGNQEGLQIASDKDDGLIAVWLEGDVATGKTRAYWCRLDGKGRRIDEPVRLDPTDDVQERIVALATLSSGKRLAVWAALDEQGDPGGIRARFLGEDGPVIRVNDGSDKKAIEPAVALNADGSFAATWMESDSKTGYAVKVRRFAADGAPLGAALTVARPVTAHLSGAAITADAAGRLCVAWNARDRETQNQDVQACFIDAEGKTEGIPFTITRSTKGTQRLMVAAGRPSVRFGEQGQLLVAWYGEGELGDRSGAHVTLLLPAPENRCPGDLNGMAAWTARTATDSSHYSRERTMIPCASPRPI